MIENKNNSNTKVIYKNLLKEFNIKSSNFITLTLLKEFLDPETESSAKVLIQALSSLSQLGEIEIGRYVNNIIQVNQLTEALRAIKALDQKEQQLSSTAKSIGPTTQAKTSAGQRMKSGGMFSLGESFTVKDVQMVKDAGSATTMRERLVKFIESKVQLAINFLLALDNLFTSNFEALKGSIGQNQKSGFFKKALGKDLGGILKGAFSKVQGFDFAVFSEELKQHADNLDYIKQIVSQATSHAQEISQFAKQIQQKLKTGFMSAVKGWASSFGSQGAQTLGLPGSGMKSQLS